MDLEERLSYLENVRDWQSLVEELEKGIASSAANAAKAQFHLKLGRILETKFLSGVKALKHFQDAYKLNPALTDSLEAARNVYWNLGKINMVQKLLELELKASPDGPRTGELLLELGDVLCDQGEWERATATYARSLGVSGGSATGAEASGCLADLQLQPTGWPGHLAALLREANETSHSSKGRLYLRAARAARRFAPVEVEGLLARGYAADPVSRQISALYEALLSEAGRLDELEQVQLSLLQQVAERRARGAMALLFGTRWVLRHQNVEVGSRFLEEALKLDPDSEGAFFFLREAYGKKGGDWDRVLTLAEEAATRADDGSTTFLLAQAGTIAWRQLGNLIRARLSFERLSAVAPEHPQLRAFEAQIGESLKPSAPRATDVVAGVPIAAPAEVVTPRAPSIAIGDAVTVSPPAAEEPAVTIRPADVFVPSPRADGPAAPPVAEVLSSADANKLAELRQLAEKQEGAKRYNEYVKTLVQLAGLVPDAGEKVALYTKAAELYVSKFANQAEAVKAYEAIVAIDPDHVPAIEYLRQMYEKRRDWEKLLGLQRREAERMAPGAGRAAKFLEIAKLATERVKKPEVCIDLWQEVLKNDESNGEALGALSGLYERAKDFERLATVLEQQAEVTAEPQAKMQVLTKLGTIYGERLNNDDGAIGAWRALLALEPNDRRAQDALKKKYLALGRWDDLEVFYADTGKWDEFIRVLEQQEAKETAPLAKVSLLFKIAQLWADKKQKLDRAAKAYEKVLELDPENLPAAEALVPIYTAANNAKALANAIEVKLKHERDPEAKLELYREVASLYETKVKDPQRAFERYLAAFELRPADERTSSDVERAARLTGQWSDVVVAYRRAIDAADAAGRVDAAIMLRLRLGRVLVENVHSLEEALETYRAVHEADSENAEAIGALEQLYRQTSRYEDLLGIYRKKTELAHTTDEKRAIHYEIAKLYEEQIRDVDKAIDTYTRILDDEPTDAQALAALDVLYGRLGRWEPYADVLRRRIELDVAETDLIDLKFRLGQTLDKHLVDPAGALHNYREILFVDPTHDGARGALEAMLDGGLRTEAAAILESIYEERGEWPKLIQALEILGAAEDELERRVGLKRKAARISAERIGDAKHAFEVLASALRDDPSVAATRDEIENIAVGAGAQRPLVALYTEIANALSDTALARDYWLRIAGIQDRLADVDRAAQAYGRVLAIDPGDAEGLAALEQLFTRTQRWKDLIGVVERRIEQTADPHERESLYATMANIYAERLGRPEDAVGAYRKVLEIDPSSDRALRALDELFTKQKMWSDLAENLDAQLALAASDDTQLALMLRLAALRESEMGLVDVAIEGYRHVLDRDPTNSQALAALERLGADPKYELTIADLLEPLYRHIGDWRKLVGVHEVQVRRSEDPGRRVDLLHQIAQLYEDSAGDLASAFATLARALHEDPAHDETQRQLDRLARATGRFADLAHVFEELAGGIDDPTLASSLTMTAARVYENDLGHVDRAIALYRRVLEVDPLSLPAAEALERLFRASERYQELSLTLQRKSEILEEPNDKKAALFQAAAIEEDVLNRPEAAIAVYSRVLEIDSDDLHAIDALIRRYLDLSRWHDLLAVYAKKADLVADIEEKKSIYYQVGAVYERELGDVARAIDTYTKILELDPDDLQALSRLDVLYEQAQNWQELLSVLTRESEMTADPSEAISFQYRIAELYEKRLEDVARAIELYRELLQRQPDHEPTLAALEGIKGGSRDPLGAASVLEAIYEAASDWAKLIRVHEVQVEHATDPFHKVELLHRIGRLHEDALGDHVAAFETYARALAFDDGNEQTLGNLERLAFVVNRWPDVARLYDVQLDELARAGHSERFVELGLRNAQVFEVQLEDVDGAIARYRRVLEVDPENLSAIRSLDRQYAQTERWAELAAILRREAEVAPSPAEVPELRHRLGEILQTRLGDLDGALAAYREVISAAPEHQATLDALEGLFAQGVRQADVGDILEPLYRSTGEWEKLTRVYEAQLAQTQGREERLAAYYRIAELVEDKLLDAPKTLDIYIRALKEFPLDEKAGEEAPRLAAAIDGGWETLANAYADVLGIHPEPEVQRAIGIRLARTFEDELGDIGKAEETYKYVLGVDPTDVETLTNLDRIYVSLESWKELAEVLEMRVRATSDELELVDLYARLGELYEGRLNDVQSAIRAYRRIFDGLDKRHEGAIAALARIYEQQGAWQDLDAVYQGELRNASGDSAEADIRAKIARLAAEKLHQPERAIETWRTVLDLRGEDGEALHALADLYEASGQWAKLVDVLEREFDIAPSDAARVEILTRRARTLSGKLGRDDSALDDWNRALDIDYANLGALRAIADIRRRQGDPNELVTALHQLVDRGAALLEADELKATFRELGKTYGERLQQPYDAADAWRRLLDVGPDFEAMNALEAIYRAEERWTDVIEVKMRRADSLLGEPREQIEELRSVAALWREQAGDADGARTPYEKILAIDPKHDEAFFELEKLHSAAGRWEPLVELYLARFETQDETAAKTLLLRKIARVFEEKLDDKNQALEALVNALSIDFHDRETARYLERMAQATGRWNEVIQAVNGWLKQQTEPQDKIRLCLHLAKWYGDDLGHPEYAQPYYAQIIQLDPLNVGATRQLASLYKKAGNWQQMGTTLTRALDVATNDIDRKEILTDLGEVLDAHMQQTEQAVTYFQRALEVDGQFLPAIENLERIYGARGQNRELVDVLQRKVVALKDNEQTAATKLRIGQLYENNLGDPAKAAQVYREVVDLEPGHLHALRGLARVYQVLERWADLVGVLEKQLEVVTTERERIDVLMHLATLHEEHFLKADLAAARLEQVLEIDPSNEDAYFRLERSYRRLRQWADLIATYERHIGATLDRKTKVELFGAIAQVYADEIEDADRAIDAYKNIVALDDQNVPALEALAKLYDRTGDAAQAIDAMTRVAELTSDTKQRVEAFYRIGKALDDKLGDRATAQERYETALDLDPAHVPTLAALRQIAMDAADYDKAARYLDQEQSYTQSPRQRAKLLVELGNVRERMLGDHASAVLAWQAAYEADGENEDAALPLVDEYIAQESWAKAEPLLDLLVRKSGKRDRVEQHDLQNKLGRVCAALGKDEKALKAYTSAHQLDLTDQLTIRGLAEVSFKLKDWGAALTNYQKVLTALGEGETTARADVYYRLGCIKREQNQQKQAINNFEKALSVDPSHRPTLEALVALYADLKDWKQVVAYKRQVLDNVLEGDERFRMLNEIADVWSDQDRNALRAIEALEEARELQPLNPGLLHKLIALYQSTDNWSKMIDTLQTIADSEKDPVRKSKFLYTMAQLYRDKEGDQDKAVELFGDALDLNPQYLEAFERINKILTAKKDWKALERAFRKMLRRMSAANVSNPELEFNLWHNLGLIYRDRLRDTTSAIESFKMATRFKPDEPLERQILAELYEATDQTEAAIGEHALVLQKDPLRVDPYRSLYKLYLRMHEYDRAWCMCAALAFLRKTEEEEQRFFEDYRPRGMIQVKSRLDNEAWVRNLFHRDENLYIGKIFEMLTPAAIIAHTNQLKAKKELPNLDRRFRQDPATSTVTFAKTFGWAAQVLGVQTPELYVRNDVPGALVAVASTPLASVAGQTVLTGFTPQELTFIVGKHLSGYRGEHYIRNLFPTLNELKVILFAGVKIVIPDFAIPGEMAQAVTATATELVKHMQPVQRESLRLVVQKWMEDGAKADLKRWLQAIEVTACRAGLLLCADLEIAKKIIAAEPQLPGDLPPAEKVKELLVFSVSEQYFSLRKTLGIAVG
jgi:tetratricopeptide (TPR) repeat protein